MKHQFAFLVAIALLLISTPAYPGTSLELECKECNYKKQLTQGPTKSQYKKGIQSSPFYCEKTREFTTLLTVYDSGKKSVGAISDVELAKPSAIKVSKHSSQFKWTHTSCPDALIPLEIYRAPDSPPCPVCGKGKVEIRSTGAVD